jgi:hypothetical protein
MTKTIAFAGGSTVTGKGFTDTLLSSKIYPNVISNHLGTQAINLGIIGGSNYEIFMVASNYLASNAVDVMVIEWNLFQRYHFYPAPNSYIYVSAAQTEYIYNHDKVALSNTDLKTLQKLTVLANHDYHHILSLVEYCNIICKLAGNNTQLIFLNGTVPWTADLIKIHKDGDDLNSNLSEYTKSLIDFDTRDDKEILQLLTDLRLKIQTMDDTKWIAKFECLFDYYNTLDKAEDRMHPGPKSHQRCADMIINYLNSI